MEPSARVPQRRSRKRHLASRETRRPQRRGTVGSRPEPRSVLPILVATFGLLFCAGFVHLIFPSQIRLVKHLFYALVLALLLLDLPATLRIARRDLWIWALLGLACTSALWSTAPVWVIKRGLVTVQTTAFGLYLASRFSLDEHLRLLKWVFATMLAVSVLHLAIDPATAFMTYNNEAALRGPFGHKNGMGFFMALTLPVFLLQTTLRSTGRWAMWLGVTGAVTLLVLSRSLSGAVIGLTVCAVIALVPHATRLRRPSLLLMPSILVIMGIIAATAGLADGFLAMLGRNPTLSGRIGIWQAALPVVLERPFLGHSIAAFWQLEIVEQTGVWFSTAHNGFLQMLIDLGVLGLGLFLLQMISMLVCALRWQRLQGGRRAVWPVCVCSFFILYNLSEVVLMRENSIIWVLYVATSFAVRVPVSRQAATA